jgi:hypothetical protein
MQRDVVLQAMAGDHEAFAQLARLSIRKLYAVARLILRDADQAEDATQEALFLEGGSSVHDLAMTPWRPNAVFADPCHWQSGEMVPDVGPTVADLAAALEQVASGIPTSTTDVTVGGYTGKRFEFTFPPESDVATACDNGELWRWTEGPGSNGGFIYGDQQTIVDYIVDVGGVRGAIDTMYLPGVPESDIAEMEALVTSIRFEWPEASPSPSAS